METQVVPRKKVSQMGPGEFVVNVREWLPDQLKGIFRDQYVMSLVGGGEEGEMNYREVGRAAMAGVMRTIHECGLTKDDADKFYAEAAQLVYGQVEGTTAPTNKEATATATPIRKTPPRRAKIIRPEPKKPRCDEMDPLIKEFDGLVVKFKPTDKRIIAAKSLGLKVWCCKAAFSSSPTCTLTYLGSCKELMLGSEEDNRGGTPRTRRGGGGDKDDRVGTVVKCCDKGECGRHKKADLEDLEMHNITKSYLKANRKKKNELGWENVAEHCWRCGGLFCIA